MRVGPVGLAMNTIDDVLAEAFHGGVPTEIETEVLARLPPQFRDVLTEFGHQFRTER
jgi:hypothetical protein